MGLFSRKKPKIWTTPGGIASGVCTDILHQPHCIIAGTTGSGKSAIIDALIYTILFDAPSESKMVLIDPKRVQLYQYRKLPHVMRYASEQDDIIYTIDCCVDKMEQRYTDMQRRGLRQWDGAQIYIIIDEYADLVTTSRTRIKSPIVRIAQLGRAAGMHLIIATQRPTSDIIDGQIKCNIDARIALRCPTARDSRNIINMSGAERLPKVGECYYLTPDTLDPILIDAPYYTDAQLQQQLQWWLDQL
jgi:S-DNA-T family DNA segregation ATPase FtsK/SpoIIIE